MVVITKPHNRSVSGSKVEEGKSKLEGSFRPLPANLTHFTTLDGLMGIVESGEIWLSNVSFLNDRRELLYGLEEVEKVVKRYTSRKTYLEWHKPLAKVLRRLRKGRIPNTYAGCFCEQSDVLSQWRGYGGSVQGVAITFKRTRLNEALENSKAALFPVIYGKLKTASQITQELSERLEELEELTPHEDASEDEKDKKAHSIVSALLPQFKHYGFRDEREWRIVVQQNTLRSTVCFRSNANVLVPYIKFKLGPDGAVPIHYVRIGPGREQELTKRSVELYLKSQGYDKIEVRLSDVPYRLG